MAKKKQTRSFAVTLPEELRAFVEEQVCANNLPSASAYVEVLVALEKASLESHLVRAIRRGGRVVADAAFWRRKERRLSAAVQGPRR